MFVQPQALADSAASVSSLSDALAIATDNAGRYITDIQAMGADEVSTALSALFGGEGFDASQAIARVQADLTLMAELLRNGGYTYETREFQLADGMGNGPEVSVVVKVDHLPIRSAIYGRYPQPIG